MSQSGRTYCKGCLGVKQTLGYSESLNSKDLIPAVRHLEWSWRQVLDRINMRVGSHAVCQVEFSRTLPYLNYAFLERSKDALFLILSERICRRNMEFHVLGVGGLTSIDRRLGLDHVVRYQRGYWIHLGELHA
jgi:hypothetical protein